MRRCYEPSSDGRGNRAGRRVLPRAAGLLASALACLACAGCAGQKLTPIKSQEQFQELVLQADRPVLVDFYKGACPTCVALEPTLDQLADEYRGRAVFAKIELMTAAFYVPFAEIKEKYDVVFFPTVILFVNGQERRRWALGYNIDEYRKALDEALGPVPQEAPASGVPPA